MVDPITAILGGIAVLTGALSYKAAKDAQKAAKKAADTMAGVLVNKESNIEPIPVIYGERRVGGTRVFVEASGSDKNKYLYICLVLCEGEIEDITDIKIDDYELKGGRYGAISDIDYGDVRVFESTEQDWVYIDAYKGSDGQGVSTILDSSGTKWTSNHKLSGVAYLGIRLRWDKDIFSGIPEITCLVKGKKVYDPRTLTTAWSDNPALCLRDYLTNNRYGKGLPTSAIDNVKFNAAANDCDTFTVTPYAGAPSTSRIFKTNAVLDTGDEIFRNVEKLLLGCRGFLPYSNGKYGLVIDQAQSAVMTLDKRKIIGGIGIQGEDKKDKFNRVLVQFPNPQADWQPDQAVWPESGSATETGFLEEDGGTLLVDEVEMETITNYYAARDFARIFCLRSRNALRCSLTATSEAINLVVGDVVNITHPTPGWSAKPFQVEEISLNYDGTVKLSLIEYDSTIYAYDPASQEEIYPDTNLPDPSEVEAPTVLVLTPEAEILNDGSVNSYVTVSFTASNDAFVEYYRVTLTSAESEPITQEINATSTEFNTLITGVEYTVTVVSVNSANFTSGTLSDTFLAVGDAIPPAIPTSITVSGNFKSIDIEWTNPTDKDLSYVAIKESTTANEIDAVFIGRSSGSNYRVSFPNGVFTRYYWLQSVDTSGNTSAWVSAGSGTTILLGAGDFADGIIDYTFLTVDVQNIFEGLQADIDSIELLKANQIDLESVVLEQQDIGDTLDTVAERMLTLATTQSDTLGLISDAGITVDPNTGEVTLQAVETLRTEVDSRVSQVEIDLDAAEAAITLKASITYVNDSIAAAVLDSADLASLEALQAQVNQAEIDIDANTASIALKADQTTLDSLDIRVTSAELDIDGLNASIVLKANTTDLTAVEDRVTTAEITLNAIDVAQIQQTVVDSITLKDELDLSAINSLQDLLYQYSTRESLRTDIALARQTLTADVTENREAIAQAKIDLAAAIDNNTALITQEQTVRATEDSALAIEILQLESRVDNADLGISGNATAITNLTSRVTVNENSITSQAGDITFLESELFGLETTVSGQTVTINANSSAITSLDTRVTSTEGSITAQASDITALETSLTTAEGEIVANGLAITSLDTRVTSTENSITSQASSITALSSDVSTAQATADSKIETFVQNGAPSNPNFGDLWFDSDDGYKLSRWNGTSWVSVRDSGISANATAVSGLDTRVTDAEGDITAQASAFTALETTVDGNTASITATQTSINGIEAQYSVSIDNNGFVSGFSLISAGVGQGDVPTSAFIINADQFAIGGTGSAATNYPFVVYPTGTTIDGVAIPAGTYMDSAYINYLSASKIETGVLNLGNQSGMAVQQGKTSYASTATGFWLGNDVGTPKFNIGTSSNFLKFDGSSLETKQIVIKDASDNIVFDANEIDGTYIKNASVDTLQIAGNAVTIPEGDSGDINTTVGTAFTKLGNSVRISWAGGQKPEAIIVVAGVGTLGGSTTQTFTLEIRRVYGNGTYTGQDVGQTFLQNTGGSVVLGAYFGIGSSIYSYIDVEIYGKVDVGTKPVENYFITVLGSKR
jgi:predicted phage tail protein